MTILQSILLGLIQGITEFLPISSSGHLVIIPNLLGWHFAEKEIFVFDVLVQVATLAGVIAYFWKDLVLIIRAFLARLWERRPFADPMARLGWYLILATIPAGVLGLLIKDHIERLFSSPVSTSIELMFTGILLVFAERVGKRNRSLADMDWRDPLWIGAFQALAIFPGISRSGATIAPAMAVNFDRDSGARFSFLMSIPVMLAAGVLAFVDLVDIPNVTDLLPVFIPGFLVAAIAGYLSIRWLLGYLARHSLYVFALYCGVIGLGSLLVNLFLTH